ncbi:MAG: methyltransferase [Desulfobacteraceae bacterium]|jgi:cyclopropane fatty-acyl-phospholipid synthase-like methyltransferase
MAVNTYLKHVFDTGFAFQQSKILLSAIEFDLFTILGDKKMTGEEIRKKINLHTRGIWDFLDALLSLGFLKRKGNGKEALYSNSEESKLYLDRKSSEYIGGILELANSRLYRLWGDLTTALKTGKPQNGILDEGKAFYETIYSDQKLTEEFLNAMAGPSYQNYQLLSRKFNFSNYNTLCDIGGATGLLSICVTKEHDHIKCQSFDLSIVEPIAKKKIRYNGLEHRIKTIAGDFFMTPLPKADIITMGMILHNWDLKTKMDLIKLAYDAIPEEGVFIVIENMIDDDRRKNCSGFLQSLNMLIEFGEAFDFTAEDLKGWCTEVGFKRYKIINLDGPFNAVASYKR